MKKLHLMIATVLVTLCFAMPAQAQFRFGIKGGVSLAKLKFSPEKWFGDNQLGYFVGPMAEFTIPGLGLGVDGALLYTQTKVKADGIYAATESVKTLAVPVNLKFTFGLGSTTSFFIAGGPQFDYNFSPKTLWEDVQKKRYTTSANLGVGVKLMRQLQIGVNYNFDISDFAEKEDVEMKQKAWQLSVAYMF